MAQMVLKKKENFEFVTTLQLIFLASWVLAVVMFFCVTTAFLVLAHFLAAN